VPNTLFALYFLSDAHSEAPAARNSIGIITVLFRPYVAIQPVGMSVHQCWQDYCSRKKRKKHHSVKQNGLPSAGAGDHNKSTAFLFNIKI